MHVKVDYSEDCKAHNNDITRSECYAIYIRKHWWNKWVQMGSGYADLGWCKRDAQKISELPIYYK